MVRQLEQGANSHPRQTMFESRRRGWRPRIVPIGLVWSVCIGLAGCHPKIHTFTVTPANVCEDQEWVTDWDISGDPDLTVWVEAEAPPDPNVVNFILTVRRGDKQPVQRQADVQQWPGVWGDEVAPDTVVNLGTQVRASGTRRSSAWPDNFTIDSVFSPDGLTLTVEHRGVTAELAADGGASHDFDGQPVAGRWVVSTTVAAGQTAPDELVVSVAGSCQAVRP